MRIASLVPSATEMFYALGLGDQVVAVTHECDYPPEAAAKPHLTRTVIPDGLSAAEIDAEVRRVTGEGRHLYELDEETLAGLNVDLIVTQAVCEVCAVSYDDVRAIAASLATNPEVISLDPERLEDVLADVTRLGRAVRADQEAEALRRSLEARLGEVRAAVEGAERPRVLALEWLDPPFVGGHWVPEMIEIAGGQDVLGSAGAKSRTAGWDELSAAGPEILVSMPCGWNSEQARDETLSHWPSIAAFGPRRVVAVDAAASFSRPGPRLIEGTELLAHVLHPDRVPAPPAEVRFEDVEPQMTRAG